MYGSLVLGWVTMVTSFTPSPRLMVQFHWGNKESSVWLVHSKCIRASWRVKGERPTSGAPQPCHQTCTQWVLGEVWFKIHPWGHLLECCATWSTSKHDQGAAGSSPNHFKPNRCWTDSRHQLAGSLILSPATPSLSSKLITILLGNWCALMWLCQTSR